MSATYLCKGLERESSWFRLAEHLPKMDTFGLCDPLVRVTFDQQVLQRVLAPDLVILRVHAQIHAHHDSTGRM